MAAGSNRLVAAVALATLVGAVAGSFVAASMDSLGISTEGRQPLLAGTAAIFVASVGGAALGGLAAALVTLVLGRSGRHRTAATAGSIAGIAVGAVTGYASERLAEGWVEEFSGNGMAAAFVGGALAGALAGIVAALFLQAARGRGTASQHASSWAALVGSLVGVVAGVGGAEVGTALAQSVVACPNGFYVHPSPAFGCVPGLEQGALLFGIWSGAAAGALAGFAADLALRRAFRPERTPPDPTT